MKRSTWLFISPIIIFIISALLHSIYNLFPSFLTAFFFPVNESIWEHNKMILIAYFIWAIIDYLLYKKENTFINSYFSSLLAILLVMIIFSPVYFLILKTNDNIFITLIIYFISLVISHLFYFKISKKEYKNPLIGLILFVITIFIFAILTFYPLKNPLFYDFNTKIYGIKK